jgi:hypothetical protein
MAELTIWWAIRLLLIGMLIGTVLMDVLFVQPIMQEWRQTIDNWDVTYDVLQQCIATCNFTVCGEVTVNDSLGEVVQI